MESQRSFLFIALFAVSFLLFQAWQADHAPKTTPATNVSAASGAADVPSGLVSTTTAANDLPTTAVAAASSAQLITVRTDVLELLIDPRGGDVVSTRLLAYPETLNKKDEPFTVLRNDNGRIYHAQSGLVGEHGPDAQAERPLYRSAASSYRLDNGQNALTVDLSYSDAAGVQYTKRFTLTRGAYAVDVAYVVKNTSAEPRSYRLFAQLKRDRTEAQKPEGFGMGVMTYLGGAYSSTEKRYEKYDFSDMDEKPLAVATTGGWVSMLQHYFVSAWVPGKDAAGNVQSNELYTKTPNGLAIMGVLMPPMTVAANSEATTSATLYVGPKIQDELLKVAPHLDLVVDYGILWWIGQPLFWLLNFLHGFVGNWGVAIILLTVVVRACTWKLTAIQYRSAARMRQLQPKLAALKERIGDDRQKFGQAMMELYKQEKVNPLGGCLPLLVQMPIFMALYYVLLESVELRHALFIPHWIDDLSAKDPFYILPVLYTLSMWVVTRMSPTPPNMDPMQAKMMQMMPVLMGVMFLFFPAGLCLYWFVGNLITIGQQYFITKQYALPIKA